MCGFMNQDRDQLGISQVSKTQATTGLEPISAGRRDAVIPDHRELGHSRREKGCKDYPSLRPQLFCLVCSWEIQDRTRKDALPHSRTPSQHPMMKRNSQGNVPDPHPDPSRETIAVTPNSSIAAMRARARILHLLRMSSQPEIAPPVMQTVAVHMVNFCIRKTHNLTVHHDCRRTARLTLSSSRMPYRTPLLVSLVCTPTIANQVCKILIVNQCDFALSEIYEFHISPLRRT
jgi:hypothetical protein